MPGFAHAVVGPGVLRAGERQLGEHRGNGGAALDHAHDAAQVELHAAVGIEVLTQPGGQRDRSRAELSVPLQVEAERAAGVLVARPLLIGELHAAFESGAERGARAPASRIPCVVRTNQGLP